MRTLRYVLKPAIAIPVFVLFVLLRPALSDAAASNSQAAVASSHAVSDGKTKDEKKQYRENGLLVKFKGGLTDREREQAHGRLGSSVVKSFKGIRIDRVKLAPGLGVQEAIRSYAKDPRVEYAEPDFVLEAYNTPDDPRFNELWGLNNTGQTGGTPGADIHATDAWNVVTGDSNVVVAVIDTGIDYTHEDLSANAWTNPGEIPGNGIDDDGNGYIDDIYGIDAYNNDSNPFDDNGHGTHVAGTIGARGNNGTGVAGVNWNVRVLSCKFLNSGGSGYTSDAIECLEYIRNLKNRGVNVVATSNSWGGGGYSQAMYDAINAQREILFVAAAGNNGADTGQIATYPSGYDLPNVISVAATDHNDTKASFSNYGRRSVHMSAPGVKILSTLPAQNEWNIPGGYGLLSGTSMATPHVSGLAALLKAQNPDRDWKSIKNLLLSGGDDAINMYERTITGKRMNAYGSLTCSGKSLFSVLQVPSSIAVGTPVTLSALSLECEASSGPVTVTLSGGEVIALSDNGISPDLAAGDGIFAASWTPTRIQEVLSFSSPAGSETIEFPSFSIASYLPNGPVNVSYSRSLSVSGGHPPYTWSVLTGTLPPGITLNGATGEFSGLPTMSGLSYFAVLVVDAYGAKAIKDLSIDIYPPGISDSWNNVAYPGAYTAVYCDYCVGKLTDIAVDSSGNSYVTRLGFGTDFDYFVVKYDPSGNIQWSRKYHESINDTPAGIAVGTDGSIYVGGHSSNGSYYDGLLVKYDPDGTVIWSKRLNKGSDYSVNDIAADANGYIYMTGKWGADYLTVKYDSSGTLLWQTTASTPIQYGWIWTPYVTADSAGNVYVTGYMESSVYTNTDIVLVKYDSFGNELWFKVIDNGAKESGQDVVVDRNGDIYVTGWTIGSNPAAILIKLDPSGNVLWSRSYSDTTGSRGFGLALDEGENVYVVGSVQGTPYSTNDFLVIKYDPAGNRLFAIASDAGAAEIGERIAIDPAGNILVTGSAASSSAALTIKYNIISVPLAITTPSLASGLTGSYYSQALAASGGRTPYTWSIAPGSLPSGLSIDRSTGVIFGTPVSAGTSTFTARVMDAASSTATKEFSITINDASFVITATAGPNGSISPSGAVPVLMGKSITFTITPADGYHVADVVVDGSSAGAVTSYTFANVMSNHTISATFAINTYTIRALAGAGGTISPSGDVTVDRGNSLTFTIAPNAGHSIADVLVDGVSIGAATSYTFSNISADHTIDASFVEIPSITVTAPNGGEKWKRGTTQTIQWTYTGNPGSAVKIELLKDGALNRTIATSTPMGSGGSGAFNWTIPKQENGSTYTIRITSTSNGSCTDISDGYVTISK